MPSAGAFHSIRESLPIPGRVVDFGKDGPLGVQQSKLGSHSEPARRAITSNV